MRSAIGLIFIALYLIAMTRPVAPYFNYLINKEYIAQNLCVNKDIPDSNCHGKCHMVKELKKVNQPVEDPNPINTPKIEIEKYPLAIISPSELIIATEQHRRSLTKKYSFSLKTANLQLFTPPPQFIS